MPDDLKEQIDEMIGDLETPPVEPPEEKELPEIPDDPAAETPEEAPPEETPPKLEDEVPPVEKPEEPPVEGKEDEPEEDELTTLRKQNEALLKRLEDVEARSKVVEPPVEEKPVEEPPAKPDLKFVDDDVDLDDLLESREKLNELLLKVHNAATLAAEEKTMRSLPQVVLAQVNQQLYLRKNIEKFLEDNEPLRAVRRSVGAIATEVASEHADWPLDKVLDETAERAYKVLGLKRVAKKEVPPPEGDKGGDAKDSPAFVEGTGGKKLKQSDGRTALQKDIDNTLFS